MIQYLPTFKRLQLEQSLKGMEKSAVVLPNANNSTTNNNNKKSSNKLPNNSQSRQKVPTKKVDYYYYIGALYIAVLRIRIRSDPKIFAGSGSVIINFGSGIYELQILVTKIA